MSKFGHKVVVLGATGLLVIAQAYAAPVKATVLGTADPYLANQPAGTTCCGGDSAPAEAPVLALQNLTGGEILTFSAKGGVNFEPGAVAPTADGFTNYQISMVADNRTGISGPLTVNVSGLVGVFTTGSAPVDPAPAQLNSGTSFKKLAPGIAQIFWIGDGLTGTGSGTRQRFTVPAGATSLYLGVVDGSGWYNNVGKITVKVWVKPAPAAR